MNQIERGDDETVMIIDQMVDFHGYPILHYPVSTKDGYILQIHRIPGPEGEEPLEAVKKADKRTPVLFLHGILATDEMFVFVGKEGKHKSLPYQMADTGEYDVWFINFRGNTFSRDHMWLNPDFEEDFWNFSIEEFGDHDLPATIEHIRS